MWRTCLPPFSGVFVQPKSYAYCVRFLRHPRFQRGSGYFNSHLMLDAQAGYDYLLDPSNSIAVLGSYGRINYSGTVVTAITGEPTRPQPDSARWTGGARPCLRKENH